MLFNILLLFTAGLVSAFDEDVSQKQLEYNKYKSVVILMRSEAGLQFKKETNHDGSFGIVYDCSLGLYENGTIELYDKEHPKDIKFLVIENCYNITVNLNYDQKFEYQQFEMVNSYYELEMLRIRNVNSLVLKSNYDEQKYYINPVILNTLLIHLADIEILKIQKHAISSLNAKNMSFKLSNLTIDNLPSFAMRKCCSKLYLENVKINNIDSDAISLKEGLESVLIVRDSHFGNLRADAFYFNGSKVEIYNNSFQKLESGAFTLKAKAIFTFSGNYVKMLQNAFRVESPKIEIIWNTFDTIKKNWFSDFRAFEDEFSTLNISGNTFNILPLKFFTINLEHSFDYIYFVNNYFNCTCRYRTSFSKNYNPNNEWSLHTEGKNFCINFGNCTLRSTLYRINDVCLNQFVCSEESEFSLDFYLKSILSTLNNINQKMNLMIAENDNSSSTLKDNLIKAELETTNTPI